MLRNGVRFRPENMQDARERREINTPLLVRYSGQKDGISLSAYLKIFNFKYPEANTEEKKNILLNLFDEPALTYFVEECLNCEEWPQIVQKLNDRFEGEKPQAKDFFLRTLQDYPDLIGYVTDKKKMGEQLRMSEENIIEALNNGLPPYLRRLALIQEFTSTDQWFRAMKKIEVDNYQQPPVQRRWDQQQSRGSQHTRWNQQPPGQRRWDSMARAQYRDRRDDPRTPPRQGRRPAQPNVRQPF